MTGEWFYVEGVRYCSICETRRCVRQIGGSLPCIPVTKESSNMAIAEDSEEVYVVKFAGRDLEKLDRFVRGRGTNRLEVVSYAMSLLYSNFKDILKKGNDNGT